MPDQDDIRVSVIMPAYNAASFVTKALGSVLDHTALSCEVLVIDDASADATASLVAQVAERDPRVRLLRNERNRGPAAARNHGLAAARGRWVALLDADDAFEPHRLDQLVTLGEQNGADLVSDNLLLCPTDPAAPCEPMLSPAVLGAPRWLSPSEFIAGNIGSRYTPRVSYGFLHPVMRRAFLERHRLRYDERNRFGEDFLLYTACLMHGARWWLVPQALYRYSVRDGSLTDVQSAADLQRIRSVEGELLRSHPMVSSDAQLAAALRRHKAKIDHFYYYRAFTDALKAKAPGQATSVLLESAGSFRHIMLESLLQGPRVLGKALRGGYRRVRRDRAPSRTGAPIL